MRKIRTYTFMFLMAIFLVTSTIFVLTFKSINILLEKMKNRLQR